MERNDNMKRAINHALLIVGTLVIASAASVKAFGQTEPEPLVDREQLKQSLAALDKLMVEFTHNPVFKEASADDAKLGAKALRDLDQIIKLSRQARKSAEKFATETRKSP